MNQLAELLGLVGAVVLWRQAYRASLVKLARSQFKVDPNAKGRFAKLKKLWAERQEKRELAWTETDHLFLLIGLGLTVVASVIKLVYSS